MVDVIWADRYGREQGYVGKVAGDFTIGTDNTFALKIGSSPGIAQDCYLMIDGSEYGGIVDGVEIDRVSLERAAGERTYQAGDYALTVEYAAGSARVLASGCPTQDCVHTGAVTRGGQSIVCLPARFILRLEGGAAEDGGVDAVLG